MSIELESQATVERLRALSRAGVLDERAHARALELTASSPAPAQWRTFISRASLVLGASLVLAAVVYFFAYNWHALHKVVKFAVLEGGLLAAVPASLKLQGLPRQVSLLFAAALLGPLLAVYGQTYQTGADPWQLFALWFVLALPFAMSAKWAPLWVGLVVVANVALQQWWEDYWMWTHGDWETLAHASLNLVAWGTFEMFGRTLEGTRGRWAPRLLAAVTVLPVTALGLVRIVDSSWWNPEAGIAAIVTGLALVAGLFALYRKLKPDLFMLSLAAVVLLTFGIGWCGHWLDVHVHEREVIGLLVAGLLVTGVGFTVACLKRARLAFAQEAA